MSENPYAENYERNKACGTLVLTLSQNAGTKTQKKPRIYAEKYSKHFKKSKTDAADSRLSKLSTAPSAAPKDNLVKNRVSHSLSWIHPQLTHQPCPLPHIVYLHDPPNSDSIPPPKNSIIRKHQASEGRLQGMQGWPDIDEPMSQDVDPVGGNAPSDPPPPGEVQ
eukprot:gene11727-322_t